MIENILYLLQSGGLEFVYQENEFDEMIRHSRELPAPVKFVRVILAEVSREDFTEEALEDGASV